MGICRPEEAVAVAAEVAGGGAATDAGGADAALAAMVAEAAMVHFVSLFCVLVFGFGVAPSTDRRRSFGLPTRGRDMAGDH